MRNNIFEMSAFSVPAQMCLISHHAACNQYSHVLNCCYRLSQNESALVDPQGRILLEQSGLALTDANAQLKQSVGLETGVYVGVMHMEYIQYMTGKQLPLKSSLLPGLLP